MKPKTRVYLGVCILVLLGMGITVVGFNSAQIQARAYRGRPLRAESWENIPWPVNSDWPGPRGEVSLIGDKEVVLRGYPVRTTGSFELPVTIQCDLSVEGYSGGGAQFMMELVPADQPADVATDKSITFHLILCDPPTDYAVDDSIVIVPGHHTFHRPPLWLKYVPDLPIDQTYRVRLDITSEGVQIRINNQVYEAKPVPISVPEFRIVLANWKTETRWHITKFRVR